MKKIALIILLSFILFCGCLIKFGGNSSPTFIPLTDTCYVCCQKAINSRENISKKLTECSEKSGCSCN